MQTETPNSRSLKARKSVLLASAFALGVTGVLAGQTLFDGPPAKAEIVQAQNLSNKSIAREHPTQDMIGFADIVETVKPAVVSVRVKTERDTPTMESGAPGFFRDLPEGHPLRRFFEEYGGQGEWFGRGGPNRPGPQGRRERPRQFGQAQGSGFFISGDGYVVTNNHVVQNAAEVEIVTDDGATHQAMVVGTDPQTDLALLKVDGSNKEFPFVTLGSDLPRIGDWVVAIGNPFGLGGTVTAGIVSARGRDLGSGPYDDFLQIDAAVNRGNSGGPTFNLKGEVVGVNTAIYSQSGGNVGIAFAVPSTVVSDVVASLRESGAVTRGWLGVGIQPVEEDMAEAIGLNGTEGALVSEVHGDTPAAKAGIENQDVILELNGQKVADPRELTRMVGALKPGADAELKVWRDGKERDVTVKLGTRPDDLAKVAPDDKGGERPGKAAPSTLEDLGISIGPSDEGVAVTQVDPSSPVSEKLREGDVILEVSGTAVSSPSELAEAVEALRQDKKRFVTFRVKSSGSGNARYVAIPLNKS